MPPQQSKQPDFIPDTPDFIPADGGQSDVQEPPEPTLIQKMASGAKDLGMGMAKGALSTVSGTDAWARQHMPAFLTNSNMGFGPPANLEHVKQMATPENATQAVGKGIEQVGEFLVPGGAEKGLAAKAAEYAPKAAPAIRMAASALGSGAVNKAQGGSFEGGAAAGAVGGAIGEGLHAIAPRIAESALNIRKLDRAYGKGGGAIGRTILDETTGLSPGSVAESAEERLGELNPKLNQMADQASVRPQAKMASTTSLRPALDVLDKAGQKATTQGERTTLSQLSPMQAHLTEDVGGGPIGPDVTPRQLLDLKRGFGNEFIHRWNPETMSGVKGMAANTYHQMAQEFNRVVPGAEGINGRISRLIPVAKRAESAELNAPTTQRMFQKIAAPTGALAGALGGGYTGYEHGGAGGAMLGAGVGLLAPTLLTTPTGEMALSRMLNGMSKPATKALVGSGLQMSDRKNTTTTKVPR